MDVMNSERLISTQAAVLGCLLIEPELCGEIFSRVAAEDFPTAEYRHVFETAKQMFEKGEHVDSVLLNVALGGTAYRKMLMDCMDITPSAAPWEEYCGKLREQSQLYRLRQIGARMNNSTDNKSALSILDEGNRIATVKSKTRIVKMSQGCAEFWKRQTEPAPEYLKIGLTELDRRLLVEPGDFIVIGGRPSAGKTALAIALADKLSREHRVGFFSLETRAEKIYDRFMSQSCLLDFSDIKHRRLSEDDFERLAQAKKRMLSQRFDAIDASGKTIADIRAIALQERYDVIFVDYLQLIRPEHRSNRTEEVSQISIGLHELAQNNRIVVVALCQLSRPNKLTEKSVVKQRAPTMEDIRESGQVEQDADAIMMLYLTDPDDPQSDRRIKIVKNKEGSLGYFDLAFDGRHQQFLERMEDAPEAQYFRQRRPPTRTPVLSEPPAQQSIGEA